MIEATVGEDVIFYYGTRYLPRIVKITRITPSGQIVIDEHYKRFYAETGKQVGGSHFSYTRIEDVTAQSVTEMNARIDYIRSERYIENMRSALQRHLQLLSVTELEELLSSLGISHRSWDDIVKDEF